MTLSRRRLLALPAAALLARPALADAPAFAPAGGGKLHVLAVGINAYRIAPLQGCVNDATLLAKSLGPIASVTTLLDRKANRAGVMAAWTSIVERCRPGDHFIFTFAGHGAQRPERVKGNEPDGQDEFLVLADFHPAEAPDDILLDDEIEAMLADVVGRGVQMSFFADCCHSGGATRDVHVLGADQVRYRTMSGMFDMNALLAATADAPPPPPAPPREHLEQVLFLAAGLESEKVPEVFWQGRPHGALSVAISLALEGRADQNGDGVISRGELLSHILRVTRGLAASRQHPGMEPAGRTGEAVFQLQRRSIASRQAPAPAQVPLHDPPIRLRISGAGSAQAASVSGRIPHTVTVGENRETDLIWDMRSGETISQLGDLLAERLTTATLPGAVGRVRVQRRLAALTAASGLDIRLVLANGGSPAAADAAHPAGTPLRLETGGLRLPYFVMFNIAGDGTVQHLYPDKDEPEQIDPATPYKLEGIIVKPPFGADLAVAVAAEKPMSTLLASLRELDGQPKPLDLLIALERTLTAAGDWQIGVQGIFTRR